MSGGESDDLAVGSDKPDFLEGGAGADVLVAGAGNDRLLGDGWLVFPDAQNTADVENEWLELVQDAASWDSSGFGRFSPFDARV